MARYNYHFEFNHNNNLPDISSWGDIYDDLNKIFLSSTGYIDRINYQSGDYDGIPLYNMTIILNLDYLMYLEELYNLCNHFTLKQCIDVQRTGIGRMK